MRLIINGIDIELTESQKISRTLQVNDILTLSNRQTNYTNTFSIKKTDKNKQTFDMLGVVGATSFLPYQKNECYLYTDDGECMVYKGWAVIQSTDKEYKINIYDGNIDLYKAIENKSLADLDLTELDHVKNLSNVVNSFTANLPYKYLVADYNGEMVYNTNRINIDYIVPSAKVSYLWNKIFTENGFTYSGSVFNTIDFTNLWLSYPKFTENNIPPTKIFEGSTSTLTGTTATIPLKFDQTIVIDNIQDVNKQQFIISEDGGYRIEVTGNGAITYQVLRTGPFNNVTSYQIYNYARILKNNVLIGYTFDGAIDIPLIIGDVITVEFPPVALGIYDTLINTTYSGNFTLIFSQFIGQVVSFSDELKDFSIKDFITEILNRFGLTPFKDKYENNYRFLTLQELLQNNTVIDWSREQNKFVEKISEKYIFGSYAQENNFTYKYNDSESDYYNSEILIDNVNLADNKVVVNSRVYAPEKERTTLIHDLQTNVYKVWDKEIKEGGSITYKGLSKRYYLMREASHTFTATTQIGSKVLGTHQAITTVPVESFYNLRMEDVVRNYYATIGAVLNYSKIIEASIYLNEKNISDMDFSKLYWIKQLSSYFLLNKVNNFIKKGITKVELIKVDYTPIIDDDRYAGNIGTINGAINLIPKLHFGFNQKEITAPAGSTIFIYQDTIYNSDEYYVASLVSPGVTITQLDLNLIKVSFATTGAKTLSITVVNNDRTIEINSNVLNITII
jgi:hypothetical protein